MKNHTQILPNRVDLLTLMNGKPGTERIVIGQTVRDGNLETVTMPLTGHIGTIGSPGQGKTVLLQSLALQLALIEDTPSETISPELVFIDLEDIASAPFKQFDRLRYPVAYSEEDAGKILGDLHREMVRRLGVLSSLGVKDWTAYNALSDTEPLRPIVVFIEETPFILNSNEFIHDLLVRDIAQFRKTGITLVLSGQAMPSALVHPIIRQNLTTRIVYHVELPVGAQSFGIGREAVDLNVKGRAWAILPGHNNQILLQTPYIASDEIEQLLTQSGRLATNEEEDNG